MLNWPQNLRKVKIILEVNSILKNTNKHNPHIFKFQNIRHRKHCSKRRDKSLTRHKFGLMWCQDQKAVHGWSRTRAAGQLLHLRIKEQDNFHAVLKIIWSYKNVGLPPLQPIRMSPIWSTVASWLPSSGCLDSPMAWLVQRDRFGRLPADVPDQIICSLSEALQIKADIFNLVNVGFFNASFSDCYLISLQPYKPLLFSSLL